MSNRSEKFLLLASRRCSESCSFFVGIDLIVVIETWRVCLRHRRCLLSRRCIWTVASWTFGIVFRFFENQFAILRRRTRCWNRSIRCMTIPHFALTGFVREVSLEHKQGCDYRTDLFRQPMNSSNRVYYYFTHTHTHTHTDQQRISTSWRKSVFALTRLFSTGKSRSSRSYVSILHSLIDRNKAILDRIFFIVLFRFPLFFFPPSKKRRHVKEHSAPSTVPTTYSSRAFFTRSWRSRFSFCWAASRAWTSFSTRLWRASWFS